MTTDGLMQLRDLVIALPAVNEPHDWANELEMTVRDGFHTSNQLLSDDYSQLTSLTVTK